MTFVLAYRSARILFRFACCHQALSSVEHVGCYTVSPLTSALFRIVNMVLLFEQDVSEHPS